MRRGHHSVRSVRRRSSPADSPRAPLAFLLHDADSIRESTVAKFQLASSVGHPRYYYVSDGICSLLGIAPNPRLRNPARSQSEK